MTAENNLNKDNLMAVCLAHSNMIFFFAIMSCVTLQNAVKFSEVHRSFTSLTLFTPEPPVTVQAD